MRPTPWLLAERYRVAGFASGHYGDPYGAFLIPHPPTGAILKVIATDGDYKDAGLSSDYAWEHVSVSTERRIPNWIEMAFVKSIFWQDDETVVQFHVPVDQHINHHPFVLHLWRPLNFNFFNFPLPPSDTIGPR